MGKSSKQSKRPKKIDKHQQNLADAWDCSEDEKKIILQQSHNNHIIDSLNGDKLDSEKFIFGFIDFDDELKKLEDQNLRSEQIYINNKYYNKIFSMLCQFSRKIYNSSIYEIKRSKNQDFDKNSDNSPTSPEQKELRIKISDILKEKYKGYQNNIYNLLDKYFRDTNNENYISIHQQCAQQIIKMATDALFSNEQSKMLYNSHPWDYTGYPGDVGYKREDESIAIFTNQQCHVERKNKYIKGQFITKNCLTFPQDLRKILKLDVLTTDSIPIRLSPFVDLRHVRIIPLRIGYKIEIVYTKVISEKLERSIDRFKELNKDRIMGIDIGVNNTMAIGCLDVSSDDIKVIGNHPILINGRYLKSVNQWFNKVVSELYSRYMRQQGFTGGEESKGQTVKMGKKFKILSINRDNFMRDVFHKLSNFVILYCQAFKIGTIVIDWSKGIKQNIDLGKINNQNFVYIPFSTKLIKMIKYKSRQFGIKVVIQNGAYTSLSSFPDDEPFDWTVKNVKDGGLKPDEFGRIHRGLFKTNKNILINDDVISAFNQIRKYRIAIGRPIDMKWIIESKPNDDKSNGVVEAMLRPVSLRIEKLLSEGSKSLISMILTK